MSEEYRTPTRQFIEVGDVHHSGDLASEGKEHLRLQLLDRAMTSSQVDTRINAIIATSSTQLEMLIQSVRELRERNSNHSTEGNLSSKRLRSSSQRFDNLVLKKK